MSGEKGLSFFDVPHRIVGSWVWELPFGRGRRWATSGVLQHIAGGWQLSGIAQYQTGNPFSILVAGDIANVGTANQRASVVGNPFPAGFVRGGPARLAFDVAAFKVPAAGTFGNIVRDAPISNWDLSLDRNFRLTERARLQFRGEFFNAFNHTQFQLFGNTLNSPTAGIWNSARPSRIAQLGLKLVF